MELDISYLSNELREKLDDHKRKEVERIRHLLRAQKDLDNGRILRSETWRSNGIFGLDKIIVFCRNFIFIPFSPRS